MIISLLYNCQYVLEKGGKNKNYPLLKLLEMVCFSGFLSNLYFFERWYLKIMLVKLYKFVLTTQSQAERSDKFVLIFFEVYPYD